MLNITTFYHILPHCW